MIPVVNHGHMGWSNVHDVVIRSEYRIHGCYKLIDCQNGQSSRDFGVNQLLTVAVPSGMEYTRHLHTVANYMLNSITIAYDSYNYKS